MISKTKSKNNTMPTTTIKKSIGLGLSSVTKNKKNKNPKISLKLIKNNGLETLHQCRPTVDILNVEKSLRDLSHKGKSKVGLQQSHREQSDVKEEHHKKIKVSNDAQNVKLAKSIKANHDSNSKSDEYEESVPSLFSPEDKPELAKKSKKKRKKGKSKPTGNGNDLNLACLAYLGEWKNSNDKWKFEKLKQIRLMSNMFDKDKLPSEYFEIFLEYMEKASKTMKKLLTTRASEVIFNVEKWNNVSDEEKTTLPKPKNYEGYERARDLLQRFE